jgi:hypothetical protein
MKGKCMALALFYLPERGLVSNKEVSAWRCVATSIVVGDGDARASGSWR